MHFCFWDDPETELPSRKDLPKSGSFFCLIYNKAMQKIIRFLIILGLILGISQIQHLQNQTFQPSGHLWNKMDLKGLDPIDSNTAAIDIIAYYLRKTPTELQIRVDYIGVFEKNNYQILVKINADPPQELSFPQKNKTIQNNFLVQSQQNYLIVKLPLDLEFYQFEVILVDNSNTILDKTEPFSQYTSSPTPVSTSLVFYNTQLGYTPAQILRNWDGAHNGPRGQRFGLKNLIRYSKQTQIPIILSDFYTPSNLAALNLLGQQALINQPGHYPTLTILKPDTPDSNWTYENIPDNDIPIGYMPSIQLEETDYFSETGLSDQMQRQIINDYFSGNKSQTFFISFPDSIISDYAYTEAIFDFLKNHPWLIFSSNTSNQNLPTGQDQPTQEVNDLINQVQEMQGPFTDNVKLFLSFYFNSQNQINTTKIFSQYHQFIDYFDAANDWAIHSEPRFTCDIDIDSDSVNECLLQNKNIFVILEAQDLYIPLMAIRNEQGLIFPIIGSSAQIAFGLSPEQEWSINQGIFSDPRVFPGLTVQGWNNMEILSLDAELGNLVLENPENQDQIQINLSNEKLTLFVNSSQDNNLLSIPILVDQNCEFQNNWIYQSITRNSPDHQQHIFQCSKYQFQLSSTGEINRISQSSSSDLIQFIRNPENPDATYPNVHYYPLGLSLYEINFRSSVSLSISSID